MYFCRSLVILYGCFLPTGPHELSGMTTTCDATEVKVTLDSTEVSHMDTSHLHVGIDSNDIDCQGAQTGNIITFVFGLGKCDPAVVVSGHS